VIGGWLEWIILEVCSNLSDFLILQFECFGFFFFFFKILFPNLISFLFQILLLIYGNPNSVTLFNVCLSEDRQNGFGFFSSNVCFL